MGIYISVKPHPEAAKKLYDHVKPLGLPKNFPSSEYHITLAYSKEGFDYEPDSMLEGVEVMPMGWEVFGQDDKVLVLKVTHPSLQQRADALAAQGYKSKFPQYRAHITVGMAEGVDDPNSLPIPDFNLPLGAEIKKPLKADFQYRPETKCERVFPTFLGFLVENDFLSGQGKLP